MGEKIGRTALPRDAATSICEVTPVSFLHIGDTSVCAHAAETMTDDQRVTSASHCDIHSVGEVVRATE